MQFAPAATSAAAARDFVTATLLAWGHDALIAVVVLLAGELVTNVLVHTHSSVGLELLLGGRTLRVEVHDSDPGRPELQRRAAWDAEGGRGLALVDALARRWGVELDGAGKSVWFEVPTSRVSSG